MAIKRAEANADEATLPQGERTDEAMTGASPNDPLTGHPGSRLPTAAGRGSVGTVPAAISPYADIGHVNLSVRDLERAVAFYRDLIGLRVTQRDEDSAFLAAGGYHHHVALNRWDREARPPPPRTTGLHHFALRLPDRTALAEVVVRLLRAGHPLLGGPTMESASPCIWRILTATGSS